VSIYQIEIDARRIDVALESRQISASQVKTTLRPQPPPGRGSTAASNGKSMPGLLKQDDAANVNGDALSYTSATGKVTYTGNARLFQGSTSISGDSMTVDRDQGDLSATGSARSTLDLETGRVSGSGHDIRYTDASRTMTYSAEPVAPTKGRGTVPTAAASGGRGSLAPVREAQVKGPQGDLHAERIEIVLAKSENRTERLEAFTSVRLKTETRSAVGARLTYHAADERYVMSGTGAVPVTIVSTTTEAGAAAPTCRQTTGRTLTFFKSTDRINVDGNEETRTETRNTPCALPTSR
jgi:lipopolysaccharide export system protein LptA